MTALFVIALLTSSPQLTTRERLYQHACYTGVAAAQSVLPKVKNEDELMDRGFASCDGSIARLRRTGDLEKEEHIPSFACSYAVAAMFAKYGLVEEAKPPGSQRANKAIDVCLENLEKQGIKDQ